MAERWQDVEFLWRQVCRLWMKNTVGWICEAVIRKDMSYGE